MGTGEVGNDDLDCAECGGTGDRLEGIADPYTTWEPEKATNEPDGLPDIGVVSLIQHLRKQGIITRQSCAGHPGESDGHVMFDPSVLPDSIRSLRGHPFSMVRETFEPEPWFELWWRPEDLECAVAHIEKAAVAQLPEETP
jgi:hypothetical protein